MMNEVMVPCGHGDGHRHRDRSVLVGAFVARGCVSLSFSLCLVDLYELLRRKMTPHF